MSHFFLLYDFFEFRTLMLTVWSRKKWRSLPTLWYLILGGQSNHLLLISAIHIYCKTLELRPATDKNQASISFNLSDA